MAINQAVGFEPLPASSPTEQIIQDLQLDGYRPHQGEPDARPLPGEDKVRVFGIPVWRFGGGA